MDEHALVAAARADPRGFGTLYQRYADRIHDYCLAVLRHPEDAADAAQDTFLIAYQRLGQLRDPGRLTPWLYAIARSRCLRRIAERRRQRPVDDLEPLGPVEPAGTGEVESAELRQLVWDAAAGLADADRTVLDLHLRQGLSGNQLADALGVPAEKANLMLHRMKERMRRTVGALLVARTGRRDCPDLAAIITGPVTPLIRKRLARHVERCPTCRARRDRLAPELLYASVPLVPAPLAVGERLTELTAAGAGTDLASAGADLAGGLRWRADGFPRPPAVGEPLPVPQQLVAGAGVAALVVAGLLGGAVLGRTIAGGAPPPAVAHTSSVAHAGGATPGPGGTAAAPAAAGGTPTGTPSVGAGVTPPGAEAAGPGPSAGERPGPVDSVAPVLSPLRLDCGPTVTAEVDVIDAVDPDPTADLMLSWDAGPGSPVPMRHVAGTTTYRAAVPREGGATGFVTFTAAGTVTDASGNTAVRAAEAPCTPVVD